MLFDDGYILHVDVSMRDPVNIMSAPKVRGKALAQQNISSKPVGEQDSVSVTSLLDRV